MATVRWVAFLLAAECVVCLWFVPRGVWSAILAALFFLFFVTYCWSLGAFDQTSTDSRKAKP